MTVCRGWSLVKDGVDHFEAIALWCKSWCCEDCAPIRRKILIAQAIDGAPNSFLTLTVNPAYGDSATHRAELLIHAYQVLIKRIRRRPGCADVAAMYTLEETKRGEPHMHILMRAPFIPQWWISDVMAELIEAPRVWIEFVPDKGRTAAYCAKYCSKKPAQFGSRKRYAFTRNYAAKWVPRERRPAEYGLKWRRVKNTLAEVIEYYSMRGFLCSLIENGVRGYARC